MGRKKKYIIIIGLAIVCLLGVGSFLLLKNDEPIFKVPVSAWDDSTRHYIVCKIENKDIFTNFTESRTSFQSDLSLEELAKQNPDFLEEVIWFDEVCEYRANLYFADNRYYVVYYQPQTDNAEGYYVATGMGCDLQPGTDIARVFVPLPMEFPLSKSLLEYYEDLFGEKYMNRFFDNISFEKACEYYERYTDKTAEIDYENQLIYVNAKEKSANAEGLLEKYLCIDFKNRRFICDKDGEQESIFE